MSTHEELKTAINRILQEDSTDELLKYGIAAKLPNELKVTPFRVGQILRTIRKEQNEQTHGREHPATN